MHLSALTRHLRRDPAAPTEAETWRARTATYAPWLESSSEPRRRAYALVAVIYVVGWGPGLVAAILTLLGMLDPNTPRTNGQAILNVTGEAAADLGVLALCALVLPRAARTFRRHEPANDAITPRWHRIFAHPELAAASMWALSFLCGNLVMGSLAGPDSRGYPVPDAPNATWIIGMILSSLLAGPTEEIFFTATIATLMRRSGHTWPVIIATSTILRIAFHAYYGWPCVGLAIWAAGAVAAYALTGRFLAPALLHSAWDLQAALAILAGHYTPLAPYAHAFSALILGLVGIGTFLALVDIITTGRVHAPHIHDALRATRA